MTTRVQHRIIEDDRVCCGRVSSVEGRKECKVGITYKKCLKDNLLVKGVQPTDICKSCITEKWIAFNIYFLQAKHWKQTKSSEWSMGILYLFCDKYTKCTYFHRKWYQSIRPYTYRWTYRRWRRCSCLRYHKANSCTPPRILKNIEKRFLVSARFCGVCAW